MMLKQAVEDLRDWIHEGDVYDDGNACAFIISLCNKTLERLDSEECHRAFDRQDLAGTLTEAKGQSRTEALRRIAQSAERFLDEGRQRYTSFIALRQHDKILVLCRSRGGGAGNKAAYFLRLVALDPPLGHVEESDCVPNDASWIKYHAVPPSQIKLSFGGRLYFGTRDVKVGDPKRKIFTARIAIELILAGISVIGTLVLLHLHNDPLTAREASMILQSAVFVWCIIHFSVLPLSRLVEHRIIILDDIWTSDQRPTVLEKIQNPDRPGMTMMRVSRYESTCGICGSEVRLRNGGRAWPDRIIGSCVNSSLEHVYSFDRFSLRGVALRSDMLRTPEHDIPG